MIEFCDVGVKGILSPCSFSAQKGDLTVIIGRNGSGKSTLLSCITDLKHSGDILMEGVSISSLSPRERAKLCAVMPQKLPCPKVTVRELVSFGRTPYVPLSGKLGGEDKDKVDWAIETAGLGRFCDRDVDTLSGGERRKAFFAMTLAQDTPNIALDEPTAHLDMRSRFDFTALLEKMKPCKTLVVVLHELTEVMRSADKIIALDKGEKVFEGCAEECMKNRVPEKYFGIELTGDRKEGFAARIFEGKKSNEFER